jgi:hypothetical protein
MPVAYRQEMVVSKGKDEKHKGKKDKVHFCTGCKNLRPGKGGAGTCKRTGKDREAGAKACGHYDPL